MENGKQLRITDIDECIFNIKEEISKGSYNPAINLIKKYNFKQMFLKIMTLAISKERSLQFKISLINYLLKEMIYKMKYWNQLGIIG